MWCGPGLLEETVYYVLMDPNILIVGILYLPHWNDHPFILQHPGVRYQQNGHCHRELSHLNHLPPLQKIYIYISLKKRKKKKSFSTIK